VNVCAANFARLPPKTAAATQEVSTSMAETWQNAPYTEQLAICIRLQHAYDNAFSDWLRAGWSERQTCHQRRCVESKKKMKKLLSA
jgi:hypothetical protein